MDIKEIATRQYMHNLIDLHAERAKMEIMDMAEHARRCIGQRHRRNQEQLGMAMVRAIGGVKIARGGK